MSYKGRYRPSNPKKYKGNPSNIVYRSLWERKFMVYCDNHTKILEWGSEEIALPYRSPIDNKVHRYFPDFYIKVRESNGKIKQPSSANKLNSSKHKSDGFYDDFLIPTIKEAYKHLPRNKWLCLNIPDLMYDRIEEKWKKCTKKDDYMIIKRAGSNWDIKKRRGQEYVYCWQKK